MGSAAGLDSPSTLEHPIHTRLLLLTDKRTFFGHRSECIINVWVFKLTVWRIFYSLDIFLRPALSQKLDLIITLHSIGWRKFVCKDVRPIDEYCPKLGFNFSLVIQFQKRSVLALFHKYASASLKTAPSLSCSLQPFIFFSMGLKY